MVFSYKGEEIELISKERVAMIAPGPTLPPPEKGQSGFWYEVRDREGQMIYVKSKFKPVGIILPFLFITVGKLRQLKSIFRGVIDIEHKARPVLRMQFTEFFEVEAVEEIGVLLFRDVTQKETVVVNRKSISQLGMFVP